MLADALSRQCKDDEAFGHHHRYTSEFATADKEVEACFSTFKISNVNVQKARTAGEAFIGQRTSR